PTCDRVATDLRGFIGQGGGMPRFVMPLLVTVLFVLPSTAFAVTTTVTAPAGGARFLVNGDDLPTVHFAGTSTAIPDGGKVDLTCVTRQGNTIGLGATPIASDVTVSGNAWQTDAQWPSNGSSVCEVVAVPAGTVPANEGDLAGRSGALVY